MKSTIMAILVVAILAVLSIQPGHSMPPQCSPDTLEDMENPKIRQICEFLQNYAATLEDYRKGGAVGGGPHFPYGSLIDNGVKRQDVDHVFLRFGRRR